jgi:hypothetical protein
MLPLRCSRCHHAVIAIVSLVSLLASCSWEFHDRVAHAHDRRPIYADIALASAAFIGVVVAAVRIEQDTTNCETDFQNQAGLIGAIGSSTCPLAGARPALAATALQALGALFTASALYGRHHYQPADATHASALSGRALLAARAGDCSTADAAASELASVDQASYDLLLADPMARQCVDRVCVARQKVVFDRARAANNDDDRLAILRDLPRCAVAEK